MRHRSSLRSEPDNRASTEPGAIQISPDIGGVVEIEVVDEVAGRGDDGSFVDKSGARGACGRVGGGGTHTPFLARQGTGAWDAACTALKQATGNCGAGSEL